MKFFLCFVLLVIGSGAWSATDQAIRNSVVKIVSKVTGTGREFRGSGLVFSHAGKRYVVSSDHVIFHLGGSLADLHASCSESGEKLTLGFVAAEWGNGLAIFTVENDQKPLPTVTLDDLLSAQPPAEGSAAALYGYPFDSEDLDEEAGARVVKPLSPQAFFVFAPQLVELTSTVGEFGMSGGPVFSSQGGFLGVLSYQKIVHGTENHLYAIPASVVTAWIRRYLDNPGKFLPYFSEPWWAQGMQQDGGLVITNDQVAFIFKSFDGVYRLAVASLDNPALFFKDGPTQPYIDDRGLWPALRALARSDKDRPMEYGLLRRAGESYQLEEIHGPTEVFEAAKASGTAFFVGIGEKHEERYAKLQPALAELKADQARLQPLLAKETGADAKRLLEDLAALQASFDAIPPKATAPGTEAAVQFFHVKWLSAAYFRLEGLEKNPAWKLVAAGDPALAKKTAEDLAGAKQALLVRILTSTSHANSGRGR